jgi:hypothetical protein
MKFVDALRQNDVLTENGMATNSTSLNACVDLFFNIGAMRGQDKQRLISNFASAFAEDPTRAMKILFWARDIRGGAGERQIFRDIMQYLAKNKTEVLAKNLKYVSEYGRWDDLLTLEHTPLQDAAFSLIAEALKDGNGLCAKWMPRKGLSAVNLRKYLELSPKEYRKTLVGLTNVVETFMCSGKWDEIEFGKLPSLASARYQKAFGKNAYESYSAYIQSLVKGEAKINAGAVYPYDVTKSLNYGNSTVANEQWKALPNYMEGANDMILPVVDVSGSMTCSAGGSKSVTCMDVAISLGLYISERNEGAFKDAFITFSSNPQLQVLSGSLKDRYAQMSSSDWGMSTNLEATFKLILDQATKHNLSQDEMPNKILILSDMEFNMATGGGGWRNEPGKWNPTAQQMIEKMYADASYKMPQIVYWNIQSRNGGVPVAFDKQGTALVSGFSPAIMTSLLGGDIESPQQIMDKTILSDRYTPIV